MTLPGERSGMAQRSADLASIWHDLGIVRVAYRHIAADWLLTCCFARAACRNRTDDLFITRVIPAPNVLSILSIYLRVAVRQRSARCASIRARRHPFSHPSRTPVAWVRDRRPTASAAPGRAGGFRAT
jgi:hypothetical protein